jgi:hypothetical protein
MSVSYDTFAEAFLAKITEFDLLQLDEEDQVAIVDGYMKSAIDEFSYVCKYDFVTTADDEDRIFDVEISGKDLYEIVNIVSEGMVVQWAKPYLYKQTIWQNVLNTRDFSVYSPAELMKQMRTTYAKAQADFTQMIREYSFNHGDLKGYHL